MSFAETYRSQLVDALSSVDTSRIDQAIAWFEETRDSNRQVFVCGNGGSASTASHFACDMVKGASFQRPTRFRILALTDSLPTITAYSNDVSYDCVFEEQLKNFAQPQDLVMGISASGNSPNVLRAIEYANGAGCKTIGLTGRDGGKLAKLAQLNIQVPVHHMGRIEDAHLIVCHIIAYRFMEN
ncbi:MAG: SIS domain-containing protein [Acidobacteriaceae bacterium]|nr:SIS domain-containing protein [Acidobacteriaceae bacterium]